MADNRAPKCRSAYTARACVECKRRKIKCSGDHPCRSCRNSIYRVCSYQEDGMRTKRNRVSIRHDADMSAGYNADAPEAVARPISQPGQDHISCLRRLSTCERTTVMSECRASALEPATEVVESCLYPSEELGSVLQCYFDELETFYPCFDRDDYYDRLSRLLLEHTICEKGNTLIPARPDDLSLAALTCGMACLGSYFGGGTGTRMPNDYYTSKALRWNQESHRLLEQMPSWREKPNLDILRLHLLEVMYMIILQREGETSRIMAIAVDLAFALELHNEKVWLSLEAHEREHHRLLWWTVCCMDRQIALTTGRPIIVRAADFMVGLPTVESQSEWIYGTSPDVPTVEDADRTLPLQWRKPSHRSRIWFSYIMFSARWSILVASIWDKFFAPRALLDGGVLDEDIARADVLLLTLRNELPASLLWDSVQLPSLVQLGNVDRIFRMRLIIFESINMLRIRIRKNTQRYIDGSVVHKSQADQQPLSTMVTLASDTMNAVAVYLGARRCARPWSTYGSILLVKVALHILPLFKRPSTDFNHLSAEQRRAVSSIVAAHSCLEGMDVKPAAHASEHLVALLQLAYNVSLPAVPMSISTAHEALQWASSQLLVSPSRCGALSAGQTVN